MIKTNTNLAKDDLYKIYVIKDPVYASILRKNTSEVIDLDKVYASYYYTGEVSMFNMRLSPIKPFHAVHEHSIIMSLDEVCESILIRL